MLSATRKTASAMKEMKMRILETKDALTRREYQKSIAEFAKDFNGAIKQKDIRQMNRLLNQFKRSKKIK